MKIPTTENYTFITKYPKRLFIKWVYLYTRLEFKSLF